MGKRKNHAGEEELLDHSKKGRGEMTAGYPRSSISSDMFPFLITATVIVILHLDFFGMYPLALAPSLSDTIYWISRSSRLDPVPSLPTF